VGSSAEKDKKLNRLSESSQKRELGEMGGEREEKRCHPPFGGITCSKEKLKKRKVIQEAQRGGRTHYTLRNFCVEKIEGGNRGKTIQCRLEGNW